MKQNLFTAAAFLAVFAFLALALAAPLPLMEQSDQVLYTQVMTRQLADDALSCVVGGVIASQGTNFFSSGVIIFVAVFLHNSLGYVLGYFAGVITGMNHSKCKTISIEVGMQNAGLATNLATTTAQFASAPQAAVICAVSCVWHSISGTLLAGLFTWWDQRKHK